MGTHHLLSTAAYLKLKYILQDFDQNMRTLLILLIPLLSSCQGQGDSGPSVLRSECWNTLCDVWYPHNWTGPLFTVTSCGPECPFCASGGTTPPPDSLVMFRCFEFPPP